MKKINPKDLPDHNDYGNPTPNELFLISKINELIEDHNSLHEHLFPLKKEINPKAPPLPLQCKI